MRDSGEQRRASVLLLVLCVLVPLFMWMLIDDDARAASLLAHHPSSPLRGPVATAPPASALAARLVARPAPVVIALGASASVSLRFVNVGSASWIRGTRAEARLGIVGDSSEFADLGLAKEWLAPNRPAAQTEAAIAPGHAGTFTFMIEGRVTGTYSIPVGLLVDGVRWMDGAMTSVDVVVR